MFEGPAQNVFRETRWVEGPFEPGPFGGRRSRNVAHNIDVFRCLSCDHLELFVAPGN
ncbi:hypothetical protein ACFVAV_28380 [Nocardia sp. NPDC057663]|uniref:hypothetical protein n=1 Tax=Nocardia sp. NPDC057663 TaxID=3346201 RepID=UPI003670E3F6